jgi:hypothetical protein
MKSVILFGYITLQLIGLIGCQAKYLYNVSELLVLGLIVPRRSIVGSDLNCLISRSIRPVGRLFLSTLLRPPSPAARVAGRPAGLRIGIFQFQPHAHGGEAGFQQEYVLPNLLDGIGKFKVGPGRIGKRRRSRHGAFLVTRSSRPKHPSTVKKQ